MFRDDSHIDTFQDAEEAVVAVSFLQSRGIDARLAESYMLATQPHLRLALGGHRLFVPTSDAVIAARLLEDVRTNAYAADATSASADPGAESCLKCGAQTLTRVKAVAGPLAILALFGVPFAWNSGRRRCSECGAVQDGEIKGKDDVAYDAL